MPDVTVKRVADMDAAGGKFIRCRAELGVSSFGLQILDLPANDESIPEHAHANMPSERINDGQEEVYIPLEGTAFLLCDGEEYELTPGTMARVGPEEMRHLVTREEPARVMVIGAMPGKPYTAPDFTEIGAPAPG